MRGITGTSVNAEMIVATLNIAGDSAGMKKRRSAFSMPIIATLTATVARNGSMMRVSRTVSASLPGTAAYSGASARASAGAKSQPDRDADQRHEGRAR